MAQLFEARLGNFLLNILDISDSKQQVIAQHEFINTDGAVMDVQGMRPRTIRFRAYFFGYPKSITEFVEFENTVHETRGSAFTPNYPNHLDFLEFLSSNSSQTLIHPKYGKIEGYARNIDIYHDDTQDYVTIDIEFIEKGIINQGFITDYDSLAKMQGKMADLLNKQLAATANDLSKGGYGSILGRKVDFTIPLLNQLTNVTQTVRSFLHEADDFISVLDNIARDIEEPFNTISSSVRFVQDVPSRILTSINSCANRVINSFSDLSNLPAAMMNNITLGLVNIADTITGQNASFFKTKFYTISAGSLAWSSGQVFQADENRRASSQASESKPSFDLKGRRINNFVSEDVMSLNELEATLASVRAYIQLAINENRAAANDVTQLLAMASDLVTFIDGIKLNRRSIQTVSVNNMPMMALLLSFGLPYNAIERVRKLNPKVKCINFTEGDIQIYAG